MFKDSFAAGIIYGLLAASIAFLSFIWFDRLTFIPEPLLPTLKPPKLQLLLLGVCMILFRIMMVNLKYLKTGKAFLLVITVSALFMFFQFR
jgi:hypothetical protein